MGMVLGPVVDVIEVSNSVSPTSNKEASIICLCVRAYKPTAKKITVKYHFPVLALNIIDIGYDRKVSSVMMRD